MENVDPVAGLSDGALARLAEHLITVRREREAMFGADLFADPAWDMLLGSFVRQAQGLRTTVSDVVNCAAVPPTTALRHLATLERQGLLRRVDDAANLRRKHLLLSEHAKQVLRHLIRKSAQLSKDDDGDPSGETDNRDATTSAFGQLMVELVRTGAINAEALSVMLAGHRIAPTHKAA